LRPVAVLKGTRKKEDWSFGPLLEVKFTWIRRRNI
jgi:hypothetical protein